MGSSVSHASLPSRQSLPRCRSLRSRTRSRGLVESFKPRSLRADTTRGARFVAKMHILVPIEASFLCLSRVLLVSCKGSYSPISY
ncbi:hypothetical protein OPV22_004752 [Ensete ventricosum]|uniref:Uncharacterized protein n=1 Tax=Ensete ventricosum TaxID=4639 RepID=A0AAV8RN23_ENSVE|nr:hypothetical protein OPV22_004752 [Ensete ventricosum]